MNSALAEYMPQAIADGVRYKIPAEAFTWFDVTAAYASLGELPLKVTASVSTLPFGKCAAFVEQLGEDGRRGHFTVYFDAEENEDGWGATARVFHRDPAGVKVDIAGLSMINDDNDELFVKVSPVNPDVGYELLDPAVRVFMCVAGLDGGTTGYRPTPRSNTAKRIRQGKKPLYDWTTVVIEPRAPKAEPRGGTHASPRAHDRRGHWVTRKSGLRYWRRPTRVGNPAHGFVFHDYLVKGTNDHPLAT